MWLAYEPGVALRRKREGFFLFSAAAPESLGADSKFAHQPVSFQCEVKLSNISRSGPLKVALLSKAQCAMEPKCNSVQTHSIFSWVDAGLSTLLPEETMRNKKLFLFIAAHGQLR